MLKTELQRARTRSSELARPDSSELRPGLQRPTALNSSAGFPDSRTELQRITPWSSGGAAWSPTLDSGDFRPDSRLSGLILPSGLMPRPFLP